MAPRVPFLDLAVAFNEIGPIVKERVDAVLTGGQYIHGPECTTFEKEFSSYVGAADCVGVGNGLDALRLSLAALGIGPGDDVLVPANTYIATWLAVTAAGARPVPVEPDESTFNIAVAGIEASTTPRTKAIIPVHLYGLPADMQPILDFAGAKGIRVIEDAAQAHGARYRGRRVGSIGDLAAWSFYPAKNLGAYGDGGAVTGSDPVLMERVRRIANYGSTRKYEHTEKGWNSRLDEIQAAVLRVKLGLLDEWNARRAVVAGRYSRELRNPAVQLPRVPDWGETVWHQFVIRTPIRDRLAKVLSDEGVETMIHYPIPPHRQAAYSELGAMSFPVTERLSQEILSLPVGPHLTQSQVDLVVSLVNCVPPD
jgi:dTDP-4-amino-4,6-dideoxygalactose transaminase